MTEKELIEKASAEGFLRIYNAHFGTDYQVYTIADSPDVRSIDSHGNTLNLEVTLTEDRPGDIAVLMGRSDSRSIEAMQAELDKGIVKYSTLGDEVSDTLVDRIKKKLVKDYGKNVALLIRDSSPLDWDWDMEIPSIQAQLSGLRNPFDKGIWILSYDKTRLFRVI